MILLGVVGGVAVLPYVFALQADKLARVVETKGGSLVVLGLASAAQSTVLVVVAVVAGLWAARRVGLQAPVTAAVARGEPVWPVLRPFLVPALTAGALSGAAVVLLDAFAFNPLLPELRALGHAVTAQQSAWKAALACLYGGFTEEILCRLFLLSVLALGLLGLARALRLAGDAERARWGALILANVLAALLFGALHLPATAALMKLTPLVVTRALVLNGLVGLVCGFLYLRRGLEAAMAAHFTADVVLHLLAPLLALGMHS